MNLTSENKKASRCASCNSAINETNTINPETCEDCDCELCSSCQTVWRYGGTVCENCYEQRERDDEEEYGE